MILLLRFMHWHVFRTCLFFDTILLYTCLIGPSLIQIEFYLYVVLDLNRVCHEVSRIIRVQK